jgi:hypothetical protein
MSVSHTLLQAGVIDEDLEIEHEPDLSTTSLVEEELQIGISSAGKPQYVPKKSKVCQPAR